MVRRRWLVPFPVLAAVVGLSYALGDPGRYASAVFHPARSLMPISVWGLWFLFGAVVLTIGLLCGRSRWMVVALIIGGGMYTFWGIGYLVAGFTRDISLAAWVKEFALGLAHYYAAYRVYQQNLAGGDDCD